MHVIKQSYIMIYCKGCHSILQANKDDIKLCGVLSRNTYVTCPICKVKNLISINGEIQSNVKIKNIENEK